MPREVDRRELTKPVVDIIIGCAWPTDAKGMRHVCGISTTSLLGTAVSVAAVHTLCSVIAGCCCLAAAAVPHKMLCGRGFDTVEERCKLNRAVSLLPISLCAPWPI